MAYLPLSTANLPDPVIDPAQGASPEDYFNTVLYSGQSTSISVTGVGFQPDLVWVKRRDTSANNRLGDVIRGTGNYLESNTTNTEGSTDIFTSFDADGFSHGEGASFNISGGSFVSWNWKANGSGVSNTDGSITSTVSANTTSGFSIVSYTGNQTAGSTVGHGLGVKPDLIILKARDAATSWPVYHSSLGATKYIRVNTTLGAVTTSQEWNDTEPTSSVFTVGNASSNSNQSSAYIGYCFHSVEGFSKFGSYVGNGSTDGTFVYTGFRPAFVMVKRTDSSDGGAAGWFMYDSTRDTDNVLYNYVRAESSAAEVTSLEMLDLLSNGFKLRRSGGAVNGSGGTYIYMAFAEDGGAFKYSLAR